ncbi:integral membrane protein [Arthrobacter crystallopoietes BAB-32]|uniref:Integral membrane protein n=1 Tax=Arthrobacter crystallopoietes BAB-32 TaxID=1246476 RepID=N1V279_9MICC|nr:integral membrane protein [Arthrobacter crystallopoietes BAB-32]
MLRPAINAVRPAIDAVRPAVEAVRPALRTASPYLRRTREVLGTDLARQCAVTLGLLFSLVAAAGGSGQFGGTAIKDAAGGAYSTEFTLLAPDGPAFSIWSPIYLGLAAYTVFQWLPGQREALRQRAVGWLVAASLLLNGIWIVSAQAGLVGLSLVVMAGLLGVLLVAMRVLNRHPAGTRAEVCLVDVPVGLYTGWILVAAGANAASWFTVHGIDLFGWGADVWAVITIAAVSFTGAVVAMSGRGRMSAALALCWGLGWLIIARWFGEPGSVPVAVAAGFGLFFVLMCGGSRTFRVGHEERRAIRQGYVPEI